MCVAPQSDSFTENGLGRQGSKMVSVYLSTTWRTSFAFLVVFGLLVFPRLGQSAGISYQATEIDAATNTWTYSYIVAGASFGVSTGSTASSFTVYFDPTIYNSLDASPVSPNADWFVFSTPTDATLPADGAYTAQAQIDGASLSDPFVISFTWLGIGTPGSQPFDISDPSFLVIGSGQTSLASSGPTPTPEPSPALLLATGLCGLLLTTRRR